MEIYIHVVHTILPTIVHCCFGINASSTKTEDIPTLRANTTKYNIHDHIIQRRYGWCLHINIFHKSLSFSSTYIFYFEFDIVKLQYYWVVVLLSFHWWILYDSILFIYVRHCQCTIYVCVSARVHDVFRYVFMVSLSVNEMKNILFSIRRQDVSFSTWNWYLDENVWRRNEIMYARVVMSTFHSLLPRANVMAFIIPITYFAISFSIMCVRVVDTLFTMPAHACTNGIEWRRKKKPKTKWNWKT